MAALAVFSWACRAARDSARDLRNPENQPSCGRTSPIALSVGYSKAAIESRSSPHTLARRSIHLRAFPRADAFDSFRLAVQSALIDTRVS